MLAVVLTTLEMISSLTFSFVRLIAWKLLVISTGWLIFISILTILHQLEIKIIITIIKEKYHIDRILLSVSTNPISKAGKNRILFKADSRLEWANNFLMFWSIFSLKKKTFQFPLSFNLYFQQKEPQSCQFATYRRNALFEFLMSQTGQMAFPIFEVIMR